MASAARIAVASGAVEAAHSAAAGKVAVAAIGTAVVGVDGHSTARSRRVAAYFGAWATAARGDTAVGGTPGDGAGREGPDDSQALLAVHHSSLLVIRVLLL